MYNELSRKAVALSKATSRLTESRALDMCNAFYKDVWPEYRDLIENTDFKWFRDYETIEME